MILVSPWIRFTNLAELFRMWKINLDKAWYADGRFFTHVLILLAGVSQYTGIFILSMITPFDPLEHRLLAPSLSLLLLAVLIGLRHLAFLFPGKPYRVSIQVLALIIALVSPAIVKQNLGFTPGFKVPSEKQAWVRIGSIPGN